MIDTTFLAAPAARRAYTTPTLQLLGDVERVTMGMGGSSCDGNQTQTQLGGGNDPRVCPGNPAGPFDGPFGGPVG